MKIIIAIFICSSLGIAQKSYEIPFASKGNTIELAIANNSTMIAEGIEVEAVRIPAGIEFKEKLITLSILKSHEEQTVSFTFSVEKTVKVHKLDTLVFTITEKTGQRWEKKISISIIPPTTFELYQNYPNPFNPVTTIEYQLPGSGVIYTVSLRVYDVIGREVMSLVNERQEPGYYQKVFDAGKLATGMYVYRLAAEVDHHKQYVYQKKMMFLK